MVRGAGGAGTEVLVSTNVKKSVALIEILSFVRPSLPDLATWSLPALAYGSGVVIADQPTIRTGQMVPAPAGISASIVPGWWSVGAFRNLGFELPNVRFDRG